MESCRNLAEGRDYWAGLGPVRRWLVERTLPIPLLGLHAEGAGLYEALHWLESNCRLKPLDEEVICNYHRKVFAGRAEPGGTYRRDKIAVLGSSIPRATPAKVPVLMKLLAGKLRQEQSRFDQEPTPKDSEILQCAVDVYQRIGLIHPFTDANGRVARLAMNHVLRRYALPYVVLPPLSEPSELWPALQSAHAGDLKGLIEFAARNTVKV